MEKIGSVGDAFTCEEVQQKVLGQRSGAPTKTCTTPQ
jgi:hypothetical protein